jgi:hypothetical protein
LSGISGASGLATVADLPDVVVKPDSEGREGAARVVGVPQRFVIVMPPEKAVRLRMALPLP